MNEIIYNGEMVTIKLPNCSYALETTIHKSFFEVDELDLLTNNIQLLDWICYGTIGFDESPFFGGKIKGWTFGFEEARMNFVIVD